MWLDALTLNVDRSWRNPNLLLWGGRPWLIDHGAALYVHHDWSRATDAGTRAYPGVEEHALLGRAGSVEAAHERLAPQVTGELLRSVTDVVPDGWLGEDPARERQAYVDLLTARAENAAAWLPAVERARVSHV